MLFHTSTDVCGPLLIIKLCSFTTHSFYKVMWFYYTQFLKWLDDYLVIPTTECVYRNVFLHIGCTQQLLIAITTKYNRVYIFRPVSVVA